jgi:hypothetical protein
MECGFGGFGDSRDFDVEETYESATKEVDNLFLE